MSDSKDGNDVVNEVYVSVLSLVLYYFVLQSKCKERSLMFHYCRLLLSKTIQARDYTAITTKDINPWALFHFTNYTDILYSSLKEQKMSASDDNRSRKKLSFEATCQGEPIML